MDFCQIGRCELLACEYINSDSTPCKQQFDSDTYTTHYHTIPHALHTRTTSPNLLLFHSMARNTRASAAQDKEKKKAKPPAKAKSTPKASDKTKPKAQTKTKPKAKPKALVSPAGSSPVTAARTPPPVTPVNNGRAPRPPPSEEGNSCIHQKRVPIPSDSRRIFRLLYPLA